MRVPHALLFSFSIGTVVFFVDCLIPLRESKCPEERSCDPGWWCNEATKQCERADGGGPPETDSLPPECSTEKPCADNKVCKNGICTACEYHDECPSLVCQSNDTDQTKARCLGADKIYVVDAHANCTDADGSAKKPYCSLQTALSQPARDAIRLIGGTPDLVYQGPFDFSSSAANPYRTIRIYGAGPKNDATNRPILTVNGTETVVSIGPSQGKTTVLLDGVTVRSATRGLDCTLSGTAQTPDIEIRRSTFKNLSLFGLRSNQCKITISQSVFSDLDNSVISIDYGSFSMTNSFLFNNGASDTKIRSPISFYSTSITFANNTLVGNRGMNTGRDDQRAVNCYNTTGVFKASLAWPPTNDLTTPQFSANCVLDQVVIHPTVVSPPTGTIAATPSFVQRHGIPYALADDQTNQQCCIDQVDQNHSPLDYFGTPRPQGPKADIGAHEVPKAP